MGRKRGTSPSPPEPGQISKKRGSARKTRPGGSGPRRRSSDGLRTRNKSAVRREVTAPQERAECFRRLYEHAPLGYLSLDAEGRLIDINATWLELLGYDRNEVLGRSFEGFLMPASRAAFRERFPEFLAAGEICGVECELVRKDGPVVTVSVDGRVERDHHASPRTHWLLRDVADERRAVEAFGQREAAYRRLVENISDALIVDDLEGRVVYANDRFLELFGFGRDELSCIRLEDYVAPSHRAKLRDYHERRVRGEVVPERFEYEGQRRDGTRLWLQVHVVPVEENGRIVGTQSLIRDVTAGKQMEADLHRMIELLESVRAAQAAFIAKGDPRAVFASLLRTLVSLTDSEFGFVDEVLHDADGTPYKLSLAISDIAWSPETKQLHTQFQDRQLEFRNLNNLAGRPALTGEPLIVNDVAGDPRAGRLPPGHPSIRTFMGLPMYFGGEVVGVAGVANRAGGYDERLARFLEPFLTTCASIIHALRTDARQDQAMQELRNREEQYRTLVANIPGVVYRVEVDPPWRVLFCSEAALAVTGYPAADFMNGARPYGSVVYPDDRPGLERAVADAVANQHLFEAEHRLVHPDGTLRWLVARGRAHYDAQGQPLWLDGVLHDVTPVRQAEQERARLTAAIEQAGEAILITDPAGTIQYVNAAFERITGYARDEAIGRNPRLLTSGRHDRAFYRKLWETITAGELWRGRFVNRRKDGTLYDEEAVIAPVRGAQGSITNFVAVKRDITEELSLAEQLR